MVGFLTKDTIVGYRHATLTMLLCALGSAILVLVTCLDLDTRFSDMMVGFCTKDTARGLCTNCQLNVTCNYKGDNGFA